MKKILLIGTNVKKSLSPVIYKFLFLKSKKKIIYKKISTKKKYLYVITINYLKNKGKFINITVPYKEKIIKLCNRISENTKKIKAINFLYTKKNIIIGYNTDGIGFYETLKKINKDKKIIIFGTGGASKAITNFIKKNRIFIHNRNEKNRKKYEKKFKRKKIKKIKNKKKIKNSIIINTIPEKYFKKIIEKFRIKKNNFIYNINYKIKKKYKIKIGNKKKEKNKKMNSKKTKKYKKYKKIMDGKNMLYNQAKNCIKILLKKQKK